MAINDRLKELRKIYGLSQRDLAKKLNVSNSTVAHWEKEDSNRRPDYETLEALANMFEVSVDFLIGTTSVPNGEVISISDLKAMKHKVSVYGVIPAGQSLEAIENIMGEVEVPTKVARKKDLFGLKIHGDSMSKIVPDGAIGIFEKTCELQNGEVGAILVNGDDATVKRFYKLNNSIVLEPDSYNPDQKPIVIEGEGSPTVTIIGKLVWFCMDIG